MDELLVSGLAAAPIITALVAAIGAAWPGLPRRVYPLVAVGLGVLWQSALAIVEAELTVEAALSGVVVGLAASGLYSGAVKPIVAATQGDAPASGGRASTREDAA
jgi:hypothetical protein